MTEEDVLHSRERYRPSPPARTPEMALAHWTERIAALPDLVASRELAGLSDEELSALALEYQRTPRHKRTDVLRHAYAASALLALTGGGLALIEATTPGQAVQLSPLIQGAGVCFVSAFIAVCAGAMSSLRMVPTEAAYAKLGLHVGLLNEQHPWLYRAYVVLRNPAALNYRDKVLRERGPIRGMDYVMMCEIAEIHAKMELTQNARAVASAVQGTSEVLSHQVVPPVVQVAPATGHVQAPTLTTAPGTVLTLGGSTEAA
jgi:hypothetical protein